MVLFFNSPCSSTDRTRVCGTRNAGSIPAEETCNVDEEQGNFLPCDRNRKGSPLFFQSFALEKLETCTVLVKKDSCRGDM